MKKFNENHFVEKFCFLHSQELSEDISWSSSDSSDYEYGNVKCTILNNITNEIRRKRKRKNKKKEPKNTSNLDITIVDTKSALKSSLVTANSPILVRRSRSKVLQKSPILTRFNDSALSLNECLPKVTKQLFKGDTCHGSKVKEDFRRDRSTLSIVSRNENYLDRRKIYTSNKNTEHDRSTHNDIEEGIKYFKDPEINYNMIDRINEHDESIQCSISEESGLKKTRTELVAKVKSYFDNHFTSEASQLSISEYETPTPTPTPTNSTNSSNEIDITTIRTQEINETSLSKAPILNTFESHLQKKKVKYKKGGLSYQLNALLNKQNSSVTLWQNERFLAANSNFVIPKQEFLVFRIKNVYFKYGIYLIEIVNKDDQFFTAIINTLYVNSNTFEKDSILKIYEPFKIVDVDMDCKILCNICKFECQKLII